MSRLVNRIIGCFSILFLSGAIIGSVFAGGLVDTDEQAFMDADFTNSELITNPWWTLPAGSNFLYYAETEDECIWNLVEVLEATTSAFEGDYSGTDARIVLDREWVDDSDECDQNSFEEVWGDPGFIEPEEVTYDWYAQDTDKNIWYMGEDTWDGESSEGSFIAGCDGAMAGIVILGDPSNGAFYQQEFYEEEAEDWGKVLNFKLNDEDDVCMKTKEWTPLERGSIEHKFYCSDGSVGELSVIRELKGKTVIVDLIGTDVGSPGSPGGDAPNPIPNCEDD